MPVAIPDDDFDTIASGSGCCCSGVPCAIGTQICVCISNVRVYFEVHVGVPDPAEFFTAPNLIYDSGPLAHCKTLTIIDVGGTPGGTINFDPLGPFIVPGILTQPESNVDGTITIVCNPDSVNFDFSAAVDTSASGFPHMINITPASLADIFGSYIGVTSGIVLWHGSIEYIGMICDISVGPGPCPV